MIKPTVGRVLWYRRHGPNGSTEAAIVCGVNSDFNVNLCVFDMYGQPEPQTSVFLWQGEGFSIPYAAYAEWMPYQVAVAAGTTPANIHAGDRPA